MKIYPQTCGQYHLHDSVEFISTIIKLALGIIIFIVAIAITKRRRKIDVASRIFRVELNTVTYSF